MMENHTKGNWIQKEATTKVWGITVNEISVSPHWIAQVRGESPEERNANAKLISAAPELLEYACCDLLYSNEGGFELNGEKYIGKAAQLKLNLMRSIAIQKATL